MSRILNSGLYTNPAEYQRAYRDYCDRTYKTNFVKEWWKRNGHLHRKYNLKTFFNMSLEQYDDLLKKQNNRCAVCGKLEKQKYRGKILPLSVDHCHKTKKIRGLLCGRCNKGIGLFKDNSKILIKAAKYLCR